MTIMLSGLVVAFIYALYQLPENIGLPEAWQIAGNAQKTQVLDWHFDWNDRYNVWSGLLGATFLFLSYFGTDQSLPMVQSAGLQFGDGCIVDYCTE